jgi:hypothetical protein
VTLTVTIAGLLLGHLLPFGEHSLLLQNLRNALHGPAFLLGSVIIWQAIQHRFTTSATALVSGAMVVAIAIGGEALQFANGYPFSLRDIGFDLLGGTTILLYMSGVAARRGLTLKPGAALPLRAGAGVLLIVLMLPAAWWSLTIVGRSLDMPQLISHQYPWWRSSIEAHGSTISLVEPPPGWPLDRSPVVRIQTVDARYAGVTLLDPYPDWQGFSSLTFLAASGDGRERRLTMRVHDEAHDQSYADRLNRSWHLGRPVRNGIRSGIDEPRRFCIPLSEIEHAPAGRDMNLGSISALAFFVTDARAGDVFLLGDMRLEHLSGEPCKQELDR